MNLLHLKYALEVEKTRSISKAAENLFMGQPNLSRAIKELEESLGITIFHRTSRGISPTTEGAEFLGYARDILSRVREVEALYRHGREEKQRFSISVPRASYISAAFTEFARCLDQSLEMEIYFRETNSMRAINNVLTGEYNLGIIRYQQAFEQYFDNLLYEKGLCTQVICKFAHKALMSKSHPLAGVEKLTPEQLADYIEVAHGDPYIPSMSLDDARKAELSDRSGKQIFVFERGSQFELLSELSGSYMWVSPIPQRLLDCYGLVEKPCVSNDRLYKDVLICRRQYGFSDLDRDFLEELEKIKKQYGLQK